MIERDIKMMDNHDLELLAVELRDKLIDTISKTGGHLASNLGVVELTIALHRVFDTSKDRLIWDVGHQSYVHKILTGRNDDFHTLRQSGGLSGFPKRCESIHDSFDTGHSSTSVSAACGMAVSRDMKGEDYDVIAVIGDGSLTGGEAYEGLNNLGDSGSKAIVIINDNGMSISPNTGGISNHLSKLRVSSKYFAFKGGVKKVVTKVPAIGESIYSGASKLRDIVKYAVVDGVFFEELGFTYLGPVDGHDIEKLTEALNSAKASNKPCVVHVITKKGKGYRNAEKNPGVFHGTGPFDKTTGIALNYSGDRTFSEVFGIKMIDLAEKNKDVVCVSAAMIDGVGLEHFARIYPDRIFDVGIAEQHAVSFAAGLALGGMKPVVAIYSSFLQRAYDQIMLDVCMQNLPVVFAIDRAGAVGADGETHQGIFDLSYMSQMPNMTILSPRDGTELTQMLDYAISLDSPVCIRYPRGSAMDLNLPRVPVESGPQVLAEGKDVHIWTQGTMVKNALDASSILKKKGIDAGVIDTRIIKPLDESMVKKSMAESKMIVSLEDNVARGGLGSMLQEFTNVLKIAWPLTFIEHGKIEELQKCYGLDGEKVAERIGEAFERKA